MDASDQELQELAWRTSDENAEEAEAEAERRPRTLRRFVARGGKLVEVGQVVRETRG